MLVLVEPLEHIYLYSIKSDIVELFAELGSL